MFGKVRWCFELQSIKSEGLVQNKLEFLPKDKYRVLNNIILYKADGHTTEIDTIIVSIYGIFVIEIKDLMGVIKGRKNSKFWRVLKFSSRGYNKTKALYNPLWQNKVHIHKINDILGLDISVYRNIVCFTSDKVAINVNGYVPVSKENLLDEIEKYTEEVLTYEDIDSICEVLHNNEFKTKDKMKKHRVDFYQAKNEYYQHRGDI